MSRKPQPGDVWWIDFGLAAKIRPALIISRYPADDELALIVVIPHTTAVRGNRWELALAKPFLKPGVLHLQQIQPVSLARLDRPAGSLTTEELTLVRQRLSRELDLPCYP